MHAAHTQIIDFPNPSATTGADGVGVHEQDLKLLEQVCGDIITASSTYGSDLETLSEIIRQIKTEESYECHSNN